MPDQVIDGTATFDATATDSSAQDAPDEMPEMPGWEGVLAVEGIKTGDGRQFADGALTWGDLPLPLRWNKEDSHGGQPQTVAVNVGRIDKVWRDGNKIMGAGVFNMNEEDGRRAHDLVQGQFLRGVSIDADNITDADVELIWPESGAEEGDDADELLMMLFGSPELIVFHAGRIRAATLCDIPAFPEAYVALTPTDAQMGSEGFSDLPQPGAEGGLALVAHGHASDDYVAPPKAWFANPQLSVPTGITVTDDGRVYGHAAQWGECHIGYPGSCVTPPEEEDHPYFMTGELVTASGDRVSVGQITLGTGHAPLTMDAQSAAAHYDNTGMAVADVAVGNDSHGIWVAGAIRQNVSPARIRELRASGQLSGDWRRIGGKLRLVGLLAVNVPGFPVPRMTSRVAAGAQLALVAAGRPTVGHGDISALLEQQALKSKMSLLAARVHRKEEV